MQVRDEKQSALAAEIQIVPTWAWILAGILFVFMQFVFNVVVARQADAPPAGVRALLGVLMGLLLAAYFLFVGYVNRDAKRRGMPRILWTCVAALIPNALGIILYFVLRQPLRSACPQCGHAIQSAFNFCPQCNYRLSSGCPQCQRAVSPGDVYCPYCGTSLHTQPVSQLSSGIKA
jgi:RNA polymerase subunit RPABC4/transcription elongation factor Spt4